MSAWDRRAGGERAHGCDDDDEWMSAGQQFARTGPPGSGAISSLDAGAISLAMIAAAPWRSVSMTSRTDQQLGRLYA
jgi:hypothetical protein